MGIAHCIFDKPRCNHPDSASSMVCRRHLWLGGEENVPTNRNMIPTRTPPSQLVRLCAPSPFNTMSSFCRRTNCTNSQNCEARRQALPYPTITAVTVTS